jgi:hypothetical protein
MEPDITGLGARDNLAKKKNDFENQARMDREGSFSKTRLG